MPELQLDVTIANRFISSLSKSLQALCHGCMDFDSGIEIVGYINVNIDSGSKVDYVLNEKVLKSTTNSMTFVSNSFLAKKDQPKQTRDGACSPIPDLRSQSQAGSPYHHSRMGGSHSGSHFHKSVSHSSPYSHVLGGAQKRPWAGDWRASPKRQRSQIPSTESLSSQHSQSFNMLQTSTQNYSGVSFKQPPAPSESTDSSGDNLVNIKKEAIETDEQTSDSQTDSKHVSSENQSSENQTGESIFESSTKANIKSDPDATESTDNQAPSTENTNAEEESDFKGTFLHPATSDEGQQQKDDSATEETNDQATANDEFPNFGMSVPESSDDQGQNVSVDKNIAGSSKDETDTASVGADGELCGSDLNAEYYQGNDDATYPPTAYSDAGEGSSDAGQFEVIEIDDEDEDVQAMFDDPQFSDVGTFPSFDEGFEPSGSLVPLAKQKGPQNADWQDYSDMSQTLTSHFSLSGYNDNGRGHINVGVHGGRTFLDANTPVKCPVCGMFLESRIFYQKHMNLEHRDIKALPFTCNMCLMGFFSLSGLQKHTEAHAGRRFECEVCNAKFKHKHHLKRHWERLHKKNFME